MKKKIVITCFVLAQMVCFGQSKFLEAKIPQEDVFVHLNTSFLLTGETLYYKVYCINSETKMLSDLSKIIYVELVSEDKRSVVKHKLRLENGQSYADFFVPSSLSSGNYKLIAYTNWMRNKNLFYENDLLIVNSFSKDQSKILRTVEYDESGEAPKKKKESSKPKLDEDTHSGSIELRLNKDSYKRREHVTLQIASLLGESSFGSYSVSVKKSTPMDVPEIKTTLNYKSKKENNSRVSSHFFMPELRGELVEGLVLNKVTGKPASNIVVTLSIPGNNALFKVTSTNGEGRFFFNINKDYLNNMAVFDLIGQTTTDFEIQITREVPMDYNDLKFGRFYISEADKDFILRRSINNQIENSYKGVKKDSVSPLKQIVPFYGALAKEYYLDDFKRFSTLKETFVEVIDHAWITSKKGNFSFKVKRDLDGIDYDLPTLLLMDGILIKNHNDIIDYDSKNVKRIGVLRSQYVYGPVIFDGVIYIETKDGSFKNTHTNTTTFELFKPFPVKQYYLQDYSNKETYRRIPDNRHQLCWIPNFRFDKHSESLSFYTSDIPGNYEVSFEGFTKHGHPVSIKKNISVE